MKAVITGPSMQCDEADRVSVLPQTRQDGVDPAVDPASGLRFATRTLRQRLAVLLFAWAATSAAVSDAAPRDNSLDLADLSIEELMNESITSVAKKQQRIADAPAAVYVLTGEDILRAGHTTIPEALRMVPGLSVARLGSHDWVISARGFAAQYAGKLLVLIDGRTVYNPFFSGVFWDSQDLLLEDLDRIEVIRGPGAALWGANAVNGVINIITRGAQDTQGGLVTTGGGTEERHGGLRYGGVARNAYYRAYLKYDDYADFAGSNGEDRGDSWHAWRGGFRTDWEASSRDQFTLQGDVYGATLQSRDTLTSLTPPYTQRVALETDNGGANILGRWHHTLDERSRWSLQAYYDRTDRSDVIWGIKRDTFDIEFQHELGLTARQSVVYGAGYRFTRADYQDSFFLTYADDHDTGSLFNAFVQDEITLVDDTLRLTLGSKFENTHFSGLEVQPSVRLLWTPDRSHSVWGSSSRAVRTPDFSEIGMRINFTAFDPDGPGPTPPRVISMLPNRDLESETVVAHELGYRMQVSPSLYLDVAAYYNIYDELVVAESAGAVFETDPSPPHLAIVSRQLNKMEGDTYGIEIAPTWQVNQRWKLAAGYTWLQMNLRSAAVAGAGEEQEGDSPRHQFHLRSFMQWPRNLTFDTAIYYVDNLPNQEIASYVRLDARLAWKPTEALELSVGAANLLDDRHAEFRSFEENPAQAQRSFHGKLAWRF